jgi:coproporphyrinogen III oxidase-like Fe-S oxidoreductase
MLRLRLKKGIDLSEYKKLFGCELREDMLQKCRLFQKGGLMNIENNCIWLTDEGMLLSNSIITELLECEI